MIGDRQAQLRLLDRWPGPAGEDPQAGGLPRAQDQPHHRRQLRRIRRSRQPDRLRLRRGGPSLLQQHRADRLLEHRHPARIPEAVRDRARSSSCASATPTPTSSATRASRTSCAGPRASSARTRSSSRDTLLKIFGQHAQTDANLHTTDGLINLFDLIAFSAGHAVKQIPFPAILLPCAPVRPRPTARPRDPVLRVRTSSAEVQAYQAFMTPTKSQPASSSHHVAGTGGKQATRRRSGPRSELDVTDGKAQAARSARSGSRSTTQDDRDRVAVLLEQHRQLCPLRGSPVRRPTHGPTCSTTAKVSPTTPTG